MALCVTIPPFLGALYQWHVEQQKTTTAGFNTETWQESSNLNLLHLSPSR